MAPRSGAAAAIVIAIAFAVTAHEASASGLRLVVAPSAGMKTDSAPVRVSIRAPYEERRLRVTLNGLDVSREFPAKDATKRGRRIATLSASHHLRYGWNTLRVVRGAGKQARRETARFRVGRKRPLVGAGRDRTVAVRQALRLDGRTSRPRTAPATRSGMQRGSAAGLRMQWRLVRRPRGSTAELETFASNLQPTAPALQQLDDPDRQPARPLLIPDKPGRYVAELTVIHGGVTSVADRVETTATLATPSVQINTAASQGGYDGIAIGYDGIGPPAPARGEIFSGLPPGNALQAVALDRETLELVSAYQWAPDDSAVSGLTNFINVNDGDNRLIIVTAWKDPRWAGVAGGTPSVALTAAGVLGKIGATALTAADETGYGLARGGQMSWIGVPGFAAGTAWEQTGTQSNAVGQQVGGFTGYLAPDSNDNYAYLAPEPQSFDLGPDGQEVSMQLGGKTFTASLPAGQGGFAAVYLDAKTLGPPSSGLATQTTYQTTNADGSPNLSEMQRMASELQTAQKVLPRALVAVRSIGPVPLAPMGLQPPKYLGPFNQSQADALNAVAASIGALGGLPQLIWGMSTAPAAQNSYSLVGLGGLGTPQQAQGEGTDIGSAASPTPSSTRLQGLLMRDKRQDYEVRGAANTPVSPALAQTLVSQPVAWPYAGSPALSCIGSAQGLGSDPRLAYWQETYDNGRWGEVQDGIRTMAASACAGVSPTEFGQVQAELVKEIGWLINVRSYIGAITQPFTHDGLSSFADLRTITNDIIRAVTPPPQARSGISLWSIFTDALYIAAEFELPGAGMIAAGIDFERDLSATGQGGPTADYGQQITAASDEVGQQLATTLQDAAANSQTLIDIIASDHGRLSTVGELGGCAPGSSGCPAEWQFTQTQQNAASRMYEISAQRQIWGGVLPAAYPYVLMTNSNPGSYGGTFEGPQEQISSIGCGFSLAFIIQKGRKLEALDEPTFLRYGIRQVSNTPFLVFSQRNFKGARERNQDFPPTSLLSRPFGALDPGGDPDKGGLGIDEFQFMVENWPQRTGTTPAMQPWRGC